MISYATTDSGELATWLAVKLTTAGYRVWLDKLSLKGGRPFIKDIEDVIKDRACRVLALMSPEAIKRPNPRRERSIASQMRDQLKVDDFIIPIRAHADFKSSDLDFYTTDHQWIDMTGNWAGGFKALLATLSEAQVPKTTAKDHAILDQLIDVDARAEWKEERLWSNLLPILNIPEQLYVYSFTGKRPGTGDIDWAAWHIRQSNDYISFRPPPLEEGYDFKEVEAFQWRQEDSFRGIPSANIVKSLIKKEIEYDCVRRGMRFTIDGKKLFFPRGAAPKDRIAFDGYDGRTWIQTVSDRKYLAASDGRCLGHLAPSFRVDFSDPDKPALRINLALHITFTNEKPVPASRIPGRRKNFTQSWFNHEWLSRTEAVASWLTGGQADREYFRYRNDSLILASRLCSYEVNRGIDEAKLGKASELITEEGANVIPFKRIGEEAIDESAGL